MLLLDEITDILNRYHFEKRIGRKLSSEEMSEHIIKNKVIIKGTILGKYYVNPKPFNKKTKIETINLCLCVKKLGMQLPKYIVKKIASLLQFSELFNENKDNSNIPTHFLSPSPIFLIVPHTSGSSFFGDPIESDYIVNGKIRPNIKSLTYTSLPYFFCTEKSIGCDFSMYPWGAEFCDGWFDGKKLIWSNNTTTFRK